MALSAKLVFGLIDVCLDDGDRVLEIYRDDRRDATFGKRFHLSHLLRNRQNLFVSTSVQQLQRATNETFVNSSSGTIRGTAVGFS